VKLWDIAKDVGRKIGEFLGFIEPKQQPPALPAPGPTIPVVTAASSQTVKVVSSSDPRIVTVAKTPGMNNTKVVVCKECPQPAPPNSGAVQATVATQTASLTAKQQQTLDGLRGRLAKDQADFMAMAVPAAQATQQSTGVPASVTLAQAILESGWGRSGLSKDASNYFGIKGEGPAGHATFPTTEYVNGKPVTVSASFRKYHNAEESFTDHANFLVENRRYAKAMGVTTDPDRFAEELQSAGYATDPAYAEGLKKVMRSFDLYDFDN
jgi:flagellum-specific peptidoglycan hydrolase FlgJ